MPRLFRKLYGRKRHGRLRGYHNHLRRPAPVSIPDAMMSVPFAIAALFRAFLSHDRNVVKQWSHRSKSAAVALVLGALLAGAAGCTVVKKDGLFYGNVGFEKQISKVSIEKTAEGEKTTVEGVKNNTPQIVEAAVGAAVRAAK